jgi:hypothetical protein
VNDCVAEDFSPSATTNGNTFLLAPGSGRGTTAGPSQSAASAIASKNVMVMDYTQDFPELPVASANTTANKQPGTGTGAWGSGKPINRVVKPNNVTQVRKNTFVLPGA